MADTNLQEGRIAFTGTMEQPITMSEIAVPTGIGLPEVKSYNKISRCITTSDLLAFAKDMEIDWSAINKMVDGGDTVSWIPQIDRTCGDLKAACMMFDANYMKALGFTKLWYKDRTPGDTSISYEIRGE